MYTRRTLIPVCTRGSMSEMSDRILILQPALPPYREWLIDRLVAHYGERIDVIAARREPDGTTTARAGDARILITGEARRLGRFGIWQSGVPLRTFLRRYAVVVMQGNPRYLNLYLWMAWCCLTGARVLFWTHLGVPEHPSGLGKRFRLALLRRIGGVLLYTEAEQQRALAWHGLTNTTGLNNTVDTTTILALLGGEAGWARAAEVRARPGGVRPLTVLFCGRVTGKARLPLLIEALAIVRRTGRDIRLSVVGDGPERASAESFARSQGVAEAITWHPATYDAAVLQRHFLEATLMVYPGNVGLSLLHAFAFGLPSIIHGHRAVQMPEADALRPGVNGALFDDNDAGSLANAIETLTASETAYRAMEREAFRTAHGPWSADHMFRQYVAALDDDRRQAEASAVAGAVRQ